MTDEQLRAMARRVLGLLSEVVESDGKLLYVGFTDCISFTIDADSIESEAVAILREEMGKAEAFDLSDLPEADPREVHFEEVEMWQERMDAINSIPFADVVWIKEGKRLSLTNDEIEAWRFVGLSNTSFVGFRENADDPTKSFVTST